MYPGQDSPPFDKSFHNYNPIPVVPMGPSLYLADAVALRQPTEEHISQVSQALPNPYQTSTAFSSARNRQGSIANGVDGSSAGLSHQHPLNSLYSDAPFRTTTNDLYQTSSAHQQPQSARQLFSGLSDVATFDVYDDWKAPPNHPTLNHVSSRGLLSTHAGASAADASLPPIHQQPQSLAPPGLTVDRMPSVPFFTSVTTSNTAPTAAGYGPNGPTLRDTLRDAREPRDPSVDVRPRDGNSQEEISTIFVVGFPDDMQEREFQNMFTFSKGFEAATLKIPNKDSTAYGAHNSSAPGPASATSSSGNTTSTRGASAPGGVSGSYAGAADPYNLVTVNSGGVVVDSRDPPGGAQTSAMWPGVLPLTSGPSSTAAAIAPSEDAAHNNAPPRKQIIGFAKFATRADALIARDLLQSKRVDVEKGAVLKAEMAKKNLHTKRGVGGGGPPGSEATLAASVVGRVNGSTLAGSSRDVSASALYNSHSSGIQSGNQPPTLSAASLGVPGVPGSLANDLHASFALSVRERESAALAALGVGSGSITSSMPGRQRQQGSFGSEYDYHSSSDEKIERDRRTPSHVLTPGASGPGYDRTASFSESSSSTSSLSHRDSNEADGRVIEVQSEHQPTSATQLASESTPLANRSAWPSHRLEGDPHLSQQDSRDHSSSRPPTRVHHPHDAEYSESSATNNTIAVGDETFTTSRVEQGSVTSEDENEDEQRRRAAFYDHVQQDHDRRFAQADENGGIERSSSRTTSSIRNSPSGEHGSRQQFIDHAPTTQYSQEQRSTSPLWPRSSSATTTSSRSGRGSVETGSFSRDTPQKGIERSMMPQQANSTEDDYEQALALYEKIRADLATASEEHNNSMTPQQHAAYMAYQSLHQQAQIAPQDSQLNTSFPVTQHHHRQQGRLQDFERAARFTENSLDIASQQQQHREDPYGLGARFAEFTIGGPSVSESPPVSSPPLHSMNARGGHVDARSNIDQNPPINTLYVGNLPTTTSSSTTNVLLEENLRLAFARCPGYRKLCFRQKSNGPMCFVEFEDVSFATKALNEMYGNTLNGLIKNGIRLSYSKNPLGVRSPSMSNGAGQTMANGSVYHTFHDTPTSRMGYVDGGRFGSSSSYYAENSQALPPRRQRDDSSSFDDRVIGPRATRQMSLGNGTRDLGGDFSGGLSAVPEYSLNDHQRLSGLGSGAYLPPASSPPPRLQRYFSPGANGTANGASTLSPVLTHGGAPSAFASLSGLGSTYQEQLPQRSSFSPFGEDTGTAPLGFNEYQPQHHHRFDDRDERDQFDRSQRSLSLGGHFGGSDSSGFASTLYNSNYTPNLFTSGNGGDPRMNR